ncbi:Rpn family recombination-promoting nuclease/putative transposase [Dolichospermum sp. ST_sed3]|nr:Rpn family recombination-promoting nuclease/putative transposase [Dolichospermum sp. ST_sed3]MDD1458401.1 Rpn family recombination-promoting nuclease/putative transposase [Dolichospermum sp. ST_sed7]MDD1461573.1 Rpn family recombination-promoting nuclease/putative transposase [Dolichospermum sp. ST_sed2]MDD1469415.1 Rpn family recombination-promoting nuclease/putative transposase [Dolichospermum sp. ST_sed5]
MRTDTIFYQLFLTFHSLLFELIGQPLEKAEHYKFTSVEVKEKAFRFDGIFMPDTLDQPIYFVEVQFQDKPDFYWEFIAEINIYLNQYQPVQDWQAVAIFAKRSLEVKKLTAYQEELINNGRIVQIYLDEISSASIGMDLVQLIVSKKSQSPELVSGLMQRTRTEIVDATIKRDIVELLETVLLSKFSKLTRQEIETMFSLSDIKQTRVYQDAKQEGIQEGRQEGRQEGIQEGIQEGRQEGRQNEAKRLLLRLLSKRFGKLTDRQTLLISSLDVEELEELGEALLDFVSLVDLDNWLAEK